MKKDYKIIYANDLFNVICVLYVEAVNKREAKKIFDEEYKKGLNYVEIMEIVKS